LALSEFGGAGDHLFDEGAAIGRFGGEDDLTVARAVLGNHVTAPVVAAGIEGKNVTAAADPGRLDGLADGGEGGRFRHADEEHTGDLPRGVFERAVGGDIPLVDDEGAAEEGLAGEDLGDDGVGLAVGHAGRDVGADGALALGVEDAAGDADHVAGGVHPLEDRGGGAGMAAHGVDEWKGSGRRGDRWNRATAEQHRGKAELGFGPVELVDAGPLDRGRCVLSDTTGVGYIALEALQQAGGALLEAAAQGLGEADGLADVGFEAMRNDFGKGAAGRVTEGFAALPEKAADHHQGYEGQEYPGQNETGF